MAEEPIADTVFDDDDGGFGASSSADDRAAGANFGAARAPMLSSGAVSDLVPLSPGPDGSTLRGESTLTIHSESLPDWGRPGKPSTFQPAATSAHRGYVDGAETGSGGGGGVGSGTSMADAAVETDGDLYDTHFASTRTGTIGGAQGGEGKKKKKKKKGTKGKKKAKAHAKGMESLAFSGSATAPPSAFGGSGGGGGPASPLNAVSPPPTYGRKLYTASAHAANSEHMGMTRTSTSAKSAPGGFRGSATTTSLPILPARGATRSAGVDSSGLLTTPMRSGGGHRGASGSPHSGAGSIPGRPRSSSAASRGVAGYKPPTGLATLEGATLEQAREIVEDGTALKHRLKDPLFLLAAEQVGVDPAELHPRELDSFRHTMGTPRSSLKTRKQFFDETRVLNIALTLSHMAHAQDEAAELAERQRRMRESAAHDLLRRVDRERTRQSRAEAARVRQRRVVERENERIARSREELARQEERELLIQQKRREKHEAHQRMLAQHAKEVARQMAEVRRRREEQEAERLDAIRTEEQHKMEMCALQAQRLAEERQRKMLRAEAKDRILEERREAASNSQAERREAMRKHLAAREEELAKLEEARLAKIQALRDERWVAEARAHANSERLRREQANRRAARASLITIGLEKQTMFEEVATSIARERRDRKKQQIISDNHWKASTVLERNITPGPGEYTVVRDSSAELLTGRWRDPPLPEVQALMDTKSWVDQTPGPSHYAPTDAILRPATEQGVRFSTANPKSYLDWAHHYGKQMPSPADYGRPDGPPRATRSFAFSRHNPMGFLDHAAYLARDSPGPGGSVMQVESMISPTAVVSTNKASDGRLMSFTAKSSSSLARAQSASAGMRSPLVAGEDGAPAGEAPGLAVRASMSRSRSRSPSAADGSPSPTMARARSFQAMSHELDTAAKMKGLGATNKFVPSLDTVKTQLEELVAEAEGEDDDSEYGAGDAAHVLQSDTQLELGVSHTAGSPARQVRASAPASIESAALPAEQ